MSKEVQRIIEQPDDLMPAMQWAWDMAGRGLAGGPVRLALGRPERKRSLDQNRLLWLLLRDLSKSERRARMDRAIVLTIDLLARRGLIGVTK